MVSNSEEGDGKKIRVELIFAVTFIIRALISRIYLNINRIISVL